MIVKGSLDAFSLAPRSVLDSGSNFNKIMYGHQINNNDIEINDGVWLSVDTHGDNLILENDRYGMFPVYYYTEKYESRFSNRIYNLLDKKSLIELDDSAIAVFLRLGYYIGGDTPFREIKAMPPNTTAVLGKDSLLLKTRKDSVTATGTGMSRNAAIDFFGELFQHSIKNMIPDSPENIIIPLSGGRDSRHILLELDRISVKPKECITVNYLPSGSPQDTSVARQLANSLGIPHIILDMGSSIIRYYQECIVKTNLLSNEHAWTIPMATYIEKNKISIAYDGIGGDILSAGLYLDKHLLDLFERHKFDLLANILLGEEGYLPKILSKKSYKRWNRELAIERLKRELEKYLCYQNPVSQFYFWNRTRRAVSLSPWVILGSNTYVLAPFLKKEIYDFLSSLPASYFLSKQFHTETIQKLYPRYSNIPFGVDGNSPSLKWHKLITRLFPYFYSSLNFTACTHLNHLFPWPRLFKSLINIPYGSRIHQIMALPIHLSYLESLCTLGFLCAPGVTSKTR